MYSHEVDVNDITSVHTVMTIVTIMSTIALSCLHCIRLDLVMTLYICNYLTNQKKYTHLHTLLKSDTIREL